MANQNLTSEKLIPDFENRESPPSPVTSTDKPAEADLLNLGIPESNSSHNRSPTDTQKPTVNPELDIFSNSSQNESDLLGGFSPFSQPKTTDSREASNGLINNLMFNQKEPNNENADLLLGQNQVSPQTSSDMMFDPLGSVNKDNLVGNWSKPNPSLRSEENFPRNSSVPNFVPPSKDPFANIANSMNAGLASSWNGPNVTSPLSTPIHSMPKAAAPIIESVFEPSKPAKQGDAFEDLLGSQGYNFISRKAEKEGPKTINEMRKVEAAKTMDPEKLKVSEWTEGKQGNLRALLCSLHTVIWPGCKWQKYEMHQLVTAADVKKSYRKACLAVHPDKVS